MHAKTLLLSSCAMALSLVLAPVGAHAAGGAEIVKKLDTDNDKTLDLAEIQKAAAARFVALDPDHDGTIDQKEAAVAHITAAELAKADPDKDATLDKNEYMALVQARFAAADADHDGTLSAAELDTPAGASLLALIQ